MNEFKRQVLDAINKHPGFTTNDYFEDMLLDKSDKPKLARVLSELKKDGYVSSVMGEDKLLCWSLTPKGVAYVAENRKGLKFDVIPQAQNSDAVAVNDECVGYVVEYEVKTLKSGFLPQKASSKEMAIQMAKELGGGCIFEVKRKKVAEVNPVTTFEVHHIA